MSLKLFCAVARCLTITRSKERSGGERENTLGIVAKNNE